MKKEVKEKIMESVLWILGIIALILLGWGIIKTF